MPTWRQLLTDALEEGERFEDLQIAIDPGELDREFDSGFGSPEGASFTAWGPKYVYFPACYDGSEWVAAVVRLPCDIQTDHIGG